jgi:hypothetical protein
MGRDLDVTGLLNTRGGSPRIQLTVFIAAAAATVVLSSCGSAGVNPTRSPTLSGLPSRSEPGTSEPASPPAGQTETRTRTEVATRTETRTATVAEPQPATSAPAQPAAAPSGSSNSSTSAWVWWLIGALVLVALIVIVVVLRRRSRRRAWEAKFTTAQGEVASFAREAIPRLEQAPTAQQIAGGWRVEATRVTAIEDSLTKLEATAVNDEGRTRARTLRDAVRAARTRLAALDTAENTMVALSLLQSAATGLETALTSVGRFAQPSEAEPTPR